MACNHSKSTQQTFESKANQAKPSMGRHITPNLNWFCFCIQLVWKVVCDFKTNQIGDNTQNKTEAFLDYC